MIAEKIMNVIRFLQLNDNDWVDLARMGAPLSAAGVQYKQLGYQKLRPFLDEFSDVLEFYKEQVKGKPPVYYVRIKDGVSFEKTEEVARSESPAGALPVSNLDQASSAGIPTKDSWLFSWASIPAQKIQRLAEELALKEKWYYGNTEPKEEEKYIILRNYLAYTFKKLVNENKIIIKTNTAENMEYASFNTGLVDRKYEYIYALFKQNTKYPNYYWYLVDFVVAGEDAGKTLVSLFNPLPPKADYFENKIENMLYDSTTGDLSCDYVHILTERPSRLPLDFYKDNCPNGFTCIDGIEIDDIYYKKDSDDVKREYFRALGEKIKQNGRVLNRLKNRLEDAVDMALKRVEWNYKTAIPMYYPKQNGMSLLLPLALVDESRVDLALVVKRQPSGAYQGETVLPLAWAYSNSRLVTRPDSEWLNTTDIIPPTSDDEELDEE
jgi:hypothetical protein